MTFWGSSWKNAIRKTYLSEVTISRVPKQQFLCIHTPRGINIQLPSIFNPLSKGRCNISKEAGMIPWITSMLRDQQDRNLNKYITYCPFSSPLLYPCRHIWPWSFLRAVVLRSASICHRTFFTTAALTSSMESTEGISTAPSIFPFLSSAACN